MKKGRPTVYQELTYGELGDYVGHKGVVKVSKAWFDTLMVSSRPSTPTPKPIEEKIKYKITDLNKS